MLVLGEEDDEIEQTLRDLRTAGVEVVTFGQYLHRTRGHQYLYDKQAGKGSPGKPGSGHTALKNAGSDAGAAAGKAMTDEDARLAALRQRQAALTRLAGKMAQDATQLSIPLLRPAPPATAP